MVNRRAKKILFDTYWTPRGWKAPGQRQITPTDLAYAVAMGYMFAPQVTSHDEAVERAIAVRDTASIRSVSRAFLASLTTRRLELRSTLGSYAVIYHLPRHTFVASQHGPCDVCGTYHGSHEEDLSILNFERYKWGGIRHDQPLYAAFDLERFALEDRAEPTQSDKAVFRQIIETAENMSPDARIRDLERAIGLHMQSNKAEREVLLQILGYCGILEGTGHPGYFERFVPYSERTRPPASRIDWSYPACWWRGSNRVNRAALHHFFPDL